jgi:3-deoxy-D-manno-octulosonic-acid transferase
MSGALARAAYALLLRLATPLVLARLWWRGRREPLYRRHLGERLGGFDGEPDEGRIWVHAVSLGETRAAGALVEALRRQRPEMRLLLTHGTATGRAAGVDLLRPGDAQAWLPWDTPGAVRRFLVQHNPAVGVLMETEIWPTLLLQARAAGVPMVLANARLSERSLARGLRLQTLLRPAVASLLRVLAQTDADARRLRQMGGNPVQVVGNMKFDVQPNPRLVARGLEWRQALNRNVVLAASTREGEEDAILQAWTTLPVPRPLLLIVPRHPQRFEVIADGVPTFDLSVERRSSWTDRPPPEAMDADVWIGDSVGEMPMYYGMSDVALLGGSFAPFGGHNLIEAAACGCPLVMGPHTFNFAEAAELSLAAGAALRVRDVDEGVHRAVLLASDPKRNDWVQNSFDFAAQHRGAAERIADEVVALLKMQGL